MNIYIYDKKKLLYKNFKFWRSKYIFLLLFIIAISALISISIFYTYFETNREITLKENLRVLSNDYYDINKRIIKAEILLYKVQLNDTIIPNIDEIFSCIPAITPIKKIYIKKTKPWGFRIHPISKTKEFHTGIDFSAKEGIFVTATGNGYIEFLKNDTGGYGNVITINHGYGYKTLYAHLATFKVKIGQEIKKGDTIATVGNSGNSTGYHLHYEVIKNRIKVNPAYYIFENN